MPVVLGEVDIGQIPNPTQDKLDKERTSPVTRSRIGNVIWFESFEDPSSATNWIQNSPQTVETVERSWNRSYHGKTSLHLRYIGASKNCIVSRPFYHYSNRVALEVFFAFNYGMVTPNDGQALFFELNFWDQGFYNIHRLEYRPGLKQWLYWATPSLGFAPALIDDDLNPIPSQPQRYRLGAYDDTGESAWKESWHQMKMYVDRSIPSYLGFEQDGVFFDLYKTTGRKGVQQATTNPNLTGFPQQKHWFVSLAIVSDATSLTGDAYFDAVTVTDESNFKTPAGI